MIDRRYLVRTLDDKVFKMLFRTLKEVNYSYITGQTTDTGNLIKERCLKIRKEYSNEGYFENIKYWPRDLGMGEDVRLLFLARVANISYNILKNAFKEKFICENELELLGAMRANGFSDILCGVKESIEYLVNHDNKTSLRDFHEIKDALELDLNMNFTSPLDVREKLEKLEKLTLIN